MFFFIYKKNVDPNMQSEWSKAVFFGSANIRRGKSCKRATADFELILGDAVRTGQPAGPKMGLRHAMKNK